MVLKLIILFINVVVFMLPNGFVYDTLRGLALNLANKNRTENPQGFS